jgi:dephospho-CoA kinase
MIIIGITGTLGAGKGTVVEYLIKENGFNHYSVRQFLLKEIRRRNLPENRDSMVVVANEFRRLNSPSFITDQLYLQAMQTGKNAVIESIRTPGEIESLRQKGNFYLFAVDADPKTRFERIRKRNSETDQIDFDTFIQNEQREMTSGDPNSQNLQKCREMADFVFWNDVSVNEFFEKVEEVLKEIGVVGKNGNRLK